MICLDEFGPLNLQPQPGGKAWAPLRKPRRIRATYTAPTASATCSAPMTSPAIASMAFSFSFSIGAGETATITCTTHTAEGTIENPAGESEPGTISVSKSLFLSNCAVTASQEYKCKLSGGTIEMQGLNAEVTGAGVVKFSQATGTKNLFAFEFEGCAAKGLNQRWEVFGNFTGTLNSATSSLEFTKAGGILGLSGGSSGWFGGSIRIETKAGEALKLAS